MIRMQIRSLHFRCVLVRCGNRLKIEIDFDLLMADMIIVDFLMNHDPFDKPIQCFSIQILYVSVILD